MHVFIVLRSKPKDSYMVRDQLLHNNESELVSSEEMDKPLR